MIDPKAPIVQQEVFGPVLTMQVFDTEAEAVALANDREYWLAASVWTRDVDRPLRIGRELEAGTVWINDWALVTDAFEEGGYKQSGRGRLRGLAALDDFLEYKHIVLNPGAIARPETAPFAKRHQELGDTAPQRERRVREVGHDEMPKPEPKPDRVARAHGVAIQRRRDSPGAGRSARCLGFRDGR